MNATASAVYTAKSWVASGHAVSSAPASGLARRRRVWKAVAKMPAKSEIACESIGRVARGVLDRVAREIRALRRPQQRAGEAGGPPIQHARVRRNVGGEVSEQAAMQTIIALCAERRDERGAANVPIAKKR